MYGLPLNDMRWGLFENPAGMDFAQLSDFISGFAEGFPVPADHPSWRELCDFLPPLSISYAIVPHFVSALRDFRITRNSYCYFLFPVVVEILRVKRRALIPEFLKSDYDSAIADLGSHACEHGDVSIRNDHKFNMVRQAALAVSLGDVKLAELLLRIDSSLALQEVFDSLSSGRKSNLLFRID